MTFFNYGLCPLPLQAAGPSSSGRREEHERCTPYFDALWFCYCEELQSMPAHELVCFRGCTGTHDVC